ncbi:MAG: putative DNA primase/helicase, partial [Oceanospirillaceae bacterium]
MSELIQKVIDSAIGQWPFIFSHLGIETPPSGKHGPCPICGGRDRFHFDNKEERGTWHCRQCEGQVAGYGLNLVSKFFDIPLYDSALKVANLLGINTYSPTTTENNLYSRNRDIAKDKEAIRTNNKHQAASKRASAIWDNAAPADPEHVYLQKKGIKPNGARQLTSTVTNGKTSFPPNTLVIPVKDNENNLSSLEFIQGNLKQGLAGGLRKGGQLILGDPSSAKNIWITEGFATGATVHQLTGEPVIIAFTANNLPKIVISAKHRFHWAILSIAGDDDTTGRKQAEIAVQNTNYKIKVPPFNAKEVLEINTSGKRMFTDWNDYFVLHGASTTLEALSSMPQSSSENELAQQSDEILHLTSYNPTTATGNSVTNCNTGESEEVLFDDNPTLMPPEPHLMISTSDRDSNIASFIANKIKGKYAISSEESEIYRWDDSAGFWVQYGTQAKCLEQIAFEELKRHVGNEGFNTAKIGSVAGMLQYTLERIPVS